MKNHPPNEGHLHHPAGLPPGTLVHVGERKVEFMKVSVLQYKEDTYKEFEADCMETLTDKLERGWLTWINVDGVHDAKVIEQIGALFQLDNLALEDIMNTSSRAKYEEFDGYIFMVVKDLYCTDDKNIHSEQISFILKDNLLITFQEEEGDVFNNVRSRIRMGSTKIRARGVDYLAYALIDAIIDNFFIVTEIFDRDLDVMEERLTVRSHKSQVQEIQGMKRRFNVLRRAILPMREVVYSMYKTENAAIRKRTHIYLRDLYDHTTQVSDTLEQCRDKVSGLMSIYLSGTNTIMNNIMKTLTIVSTIFMALSLIAGIYGMNFKHMPETEWYYGYFFTLGAMAVVALLLFLYFRRKKWLD